MILRATKKILPLMLGLLLPLSSANAQLLPELMTPADPNDDQRIVFLVDDQVVTAGMLREFYQSRGLREPADPIARRQQHLQVSNELINLLLMQREAEARQLDQTASVREALRLARSTVLSKALIRDEMANLEVTDSDRTSAYQQILDEAEQQAQFQATHILVEDQATAEKIISQLQAGDDFQALYRQYSTEQFGAEADQPAEWFGLESQDPAIAMALKSLNAGEVTPTPVNTAFGWHVIRVDKRQVQPVPPLAEIQDGLDELIREKKIKQRIEDMRAKANIRRPGQSQPVPAVP